MASGDEWDPQRTLDLYLHDYMVRRKMHTTAEIFRKEANVRNNPVVIETSEGFLSEWWSIFHDMYASRQLKHDQVKAEASLQATTEQQNIHPVASHMLLNQQRTGQFPIGTDFDKMLGQPAACLLAAKNYEDEQHTNPAAARNFNPNLKPDVNSSSHLQKQIFNQAQLRIDNRLGFSLGTAVSVDHTLYGDNGVPKGINKGVNPVPLNGWPLTGYQVLNSIMQTTNDQQQFRMSAAQEQELLAEVLSHNPGNLTASFPGSSSKCDSRNMMLPDNEFSGKDGQVLVQMKQSAEHQHQHDKRQRQLQLLENDRKRIALPYSKTGDNSLDCVKAEEKHMNDVESFLSHNDDNPNRSSSALSVSKCHLTAREQIKGFTFEEISCLRSSKSKVLCCHFSSDGKLLASAGHEKKVMIWNTETFNFVNSSEGHSNLITDVRFKECSPIFATSSFDRTVQIWNAANPSKSLFSLLGHTEQVMSLDFHPRNNDLLCSCDCNDEIRVWNVNKCGCTRISKGATKQVRFQPRVGKLLATASGDCINIIDVETDSLQFSLKGHVKDVHSICWDTSGNYIASVSEDSARVWSALSGGKCIHELHSHGNKFRSCTYHPRYPELLIVGGYESLKLWNPTASSYSCPVPAHRGLIAALANTTQTEMVASVSHDHCVKLWK